MPYKNKEDRDKYQKSYNDSNKDRAKMWRDANKDKIKSYRDNNKDALKGWHKKYAYFKSYTLALPQDYEHYLSTTHCEWCKVEFSEGKSRTGKCQHHNHESGELKGVICSSCNIIEGMVRDADHLLSIYQAMQRGYR